MTLWSRGKQSMLKVAAVLALLLGFALPAKAVTIHDLMALSHAGLSDQVLIALIQTDNTIYAVDAKQVLALRKAGVSESVILALLQNGRATAPEQKASVAPAASSADAATAPATELAPHLTIIGDHSRDQLDDESASSADGTIVVQTVVPELYPVPVVVGGYGHGYPGTHHVVRSSRSPVPGYKGFGRFINDGFIDGSGARSNINRGSSIKADGWRIVTPRVVTPHVRGQH